MSKRIIFLLVVVALAAGGGAWWWLHQGQETTDNAYVKADIVPVMSRINGTVTQILVADNQKVTAGTPLSNSTRGITRSPWPKPRPIWPSSNRCSTT